MLVIAPQQMGVMGGMGNSVITGSCSCNCSGFVILATRQQAAELGRLQRLVLRPVLLQSQGATKSPPNSHVAETRVTNYSDYLRRYFFGRWQ